MQRWRDLVVTNVVALVLLLVVFLINWREAAAFGLAVLVIMDLMVIIRKRGARSDAEKGDGEYEDRDEN
jgi:uncharacterized membrane protein YhaH (DUF805 family)